MLPPASSAGNEGLADREGRTAVCEADLDHHVGVLSDEEIAQDIAIGAGKRDTVEVAFRPDVVRAGLNKLATCPSHAVQQLELS
jgi:hypothetical protein